MTPRWTALRWLGLLSLGLGLLALLVLTWLMARQAVRFQSLEFAETLRLLKPLLRPWMYWTSAGLTLVCGGLVLTRAAAGRGANE